MDVAAVKLFPSTSSFLRATDGMDFCPCSLVVGASTEIAFLACNYRTASRQPSVFYKVENFVKAMKALG